MDEIEYGHDDFVASTEITPRSPRWYWRKRLVADDLNILAGTQGLGKSQVAMSIAAEATRRDETVLWISAEESADTTIVPRLRAADGSERGESGEPLFHIWKQGRAWSLTDGAKLLDYVQRLGAKLVVIDPIVAFAGRVDAHRDSEVRTLLAPLRAVAEVESVTIIAVMHTKKGMESEAVNSVGGSIAWTSAPRSVLILRRDEEQGPDDLILWHAKCNVGRKQPALALTVEADEWGEVGNFETSHIKWAEEHPERDIQAAFLPRDLRVTGKLPTPALDRNVEWLKEELGDGLWHLANEVNDHAKAAGINTNSKTWPKARKALGLESRNSNGIWSLRWLAAQHSPQE